MKELKSREISMVKRMFTINYPLYKEIERLEDKVKKLQDEINLKKQMIDANEAGIIALTGGYKSGDLVNCEYVLLYNDDNTPKMDKDNKYQLKKRVLTFHYPVEDNNEKGIELSSKDDTINPVFECNPTINNSTIE